MNRIIARVLLLETLLITAATGIGPLTARAEEAGSGHYLPGTAGTLSTCCPIRDSLTLVYANAFTYYHGSAGASRRVEFGGEVTANAKATIYADTSLFLLQTPWKLLAANTAPRWWCPTSGWR